MTVSQVSLDQIGQHFNIDKASLFRTAEGEVRPGNDYYRHYARALAEMRHDTVQLLQLGTGADVNSLSSMRVWDEYFTHRAARFVGAGFDEGVRAAPGTRLHFEPGDIGSDNFLRQIARAFTGLDVIIDDASHQWLHQITAFRALFPQLKPGGLYAIEAVGTSFGEQVRSLYGALGGDDTFTLMSAFANRLVGNGFSHPVDEVIPPDIVDEHLFATIESITLARGMIMIRKTAS